MTWTQFATKYKTCYCNRLSDGWECHTPAGCVFCDTIEDCRDLANKFGCRITL